MANIEEGAATPNWRQGQEQPQPKMQLDKGTYILTGQTLSHNFQESQRKMQKHIYCVQMIGWMPTALMKI